MAKLLEFKLGLERLLAPESLLCPWALFSIGITHVFSCINICRVPRMLFEHEADRPSVRHHPRDRQVLM